MCSALRNSSMPSDRKSTRLNSSHTVIYTLSLHDALPISRMRYAICAESTSKGTVFLSFHRMNVFCSSEFFNAFRSEEHTSELQSHRDLHSFPTRRSSDLENAIRNLRGVHIKGNRLFKFPSDECVLLFGILQCL